MRYFMMCLFTMCVMISNSYGGVIVSQPSNLNDYISVQLIPSEDTPPIKANGLLTTNGS